MSTKFKSITKKQALALAPGAILEIALKFEGVKLGSTSEREYCILLEAADPRCFQSDLLVWFPQNQATNMEPHDDSWISYKQVSAVRGHLEFNITAEAALVSLKT